MILKITTALLIALISSITVAQENILTTKNNYNFIGVGYTMGETMPPTGRFPETKTQQGFDLTLGSSTYKNDSWAKLLNYPKRGILLSYADFGNQEKVGYGLSLLYFFDFGVLNKFTNRIRFQTGFGSSYNNIIYNKVTNPGNYAISTNFTWAFRSFLYYDLVHSKDFNVKIGGGITHSSNGHTRWPNYGLNSYLATVKTEFNFNKQAIDLSENTPDIGLSNKQNYYSTRLGFGQKALFVNFNSRKDVYTASFEMGRIKNELLKYGLGFYYRFYEDYYDYIKEEGTVVTNYFSELTNNPYQSATAIGVFGHYEVLLNHFSFEAELGINLYKPAYKLDWYVNYIKYDKQIGYYSREFGTAAKINQYVSSRLGVRYYAVTANKAPQHNVFLAANINANFGQADFSELSFGYVYCPKSKNK